MGLPILQTPTASIILPSTGQEVTFRPFLVKEEKILLMAMESKTQKDITRALKQVLESCVLSPKLDFGILPSFDIEYLFLNIRAKSVGEVITLELGHDDKSACSHKTEVDLDIDKIVPPKVDKKQLVLDISDTIKVKMKWPTLTQVEKITDQNDPKQIFELMTDCIELILEGDTVYEVSNFSKKEVMEFIESSTSTQFKKYVDFFMNMPKLQYDIEYTCPVCKTSEKVHLEGLQSFFQ